MADDSYTATAVKSKGDGRYKVRLAHPDDRKKIVFSSLSEGRARKYLQDKYPRGTTAYLEKPDGSCEHYEPERADERGVEAEPWAEFDPDSYRPPEETPAPGTSEWADTEG